MMGFLCHVYLAEQSQCLKERPNMVILQVLVVTFTWLFVAPTLTCWLWRVAFVRSFHQVRPAA